MVGFRIVKQNPPAIELSHGWGDIGGTLVLVDGQIELAEGAGTAIDNAIGKSFYVRNVYFSGPQEAIKSADHPAIECSGQWTRVREYVYCNKVSRQDYDIYTAQSGKEALEKLGSRESGAGRRREARPSTAA